MEEGIRKPPDREESDPPLHFSTGQGRGISPRAPGGVSLGAPVDGDTEDRPGGTRLSRAGCQENLTGLGGFSELASRAPSRKDFNSNFLPGSEASVHFLSFLFGSKF